MRVGADVSRLGVSQRRKKLSLIVRDVGGRSVGAILLFLLLLFCFLTMK